MSALKAHEVDRFLTNPNLQTGLLLIYGTDAGLIRERGKQLADRFAGPNPDPMASISLDMSEIDADKSLLASEARTMSLFGGKKTIRVRNASKALAPLIEELLGDWPDAVVIVETGNLTPKDKLRALAEKAKVARTLPCYADSDQSLSQLIQKTFSDNGVSIDNDVASTLTDMLGNDREVTRSELDKLVLYAETNKTLSREEVLVLCGDNTSIAVDQIIDATATGHVTKLEDALTRAFTAGLETQRILIAALNHFVSLRHLRLQIDKGQAASQVLASARPRPHFSRKASLEQQLRLWSQQNLAKAGKRLSDAILESRRSSQLSDSIAKRALLALCIMAARL